MKITSILTQQIEEDPFCTNGMGVAFDKGPTRTFNRRFKMKYLMHALVLTATALSCGLAYAEDGQAYGPKILLSVDEANAIHANVTYAPIGSGLMVMTLFIRGGEVTKGMDGDIPPPFMSIVNYRTGEIVKEAEVTGIAGFPVTKQSEQGLTFFIRDSMQIAKIRADFSNTGVVFINARGVPVGHVDFNEICERDASRAIDVSTGKSLCKDL